MTPSRREFIAAGAGAGFAAGIATIEDHAGSLHAAVRVPARRQSRARVSLALVGDVFMLRPFPAAVAPATEALIARLAECDVAIANLENGLSTVGAAELGGMRYGPSLRGDPALVRELARYGFDAVSLANNHTGNFGPDALLQTMHTLEATGIRHAGAGADPDAAYRGARIRAGGGVIGLVSAYSFYSEYGADDIARPGHAGIAGARAYDVVLGAETSHAFEAMTPDSTPAFVAPLSTSPSRHTIAPLRSDLERLARAVRETRADVDYMVASIHFHWGRHNRSDVPFHQRAFARALIDAGADIVVGHGPHVLRGIEIYGGGVIAHSVGNFVLGSQDGADPSTVTPPGTRDPYREGIVLRVVTDNGTTHLDVLPVWIPPDGRPRLASGAHARDILTTLAALSGSFGTDLSVGATAGELTVSRQGG